MRNLKMASRILASEWPRMVSDFPRPLVLLLALAFLTASPVCVLMGLLAPMQLFDEFMFLVLGALLCCLWWEMGGRRLYG